jgi:hypothetical protein
MWSLSSRKKLRLRAFQNKILRIIRNYERGNNRKLEKTAL